MAAGAAGLVAKEPCLEALAVSELPPHTRLILASEDLLEHFGTRTERGERITAEWGEPSSEGWYEPTFTVHADDRIGTLDAAWAAAEAALPEGWFIGTLSNRPYVNHPYRTWLAQAYEPTEQMAFVAGFGDTPAAALLALAEKLAQR